MRTGAIVADNWFFSAWRGIVIASVPSRGRTPGPLAFVVFASIFSFGASFATGVAHAQGQPRRVLVLHTYTSQVPASVIAGESASKRLIERAQEQVELYTEFLDFARFAADGHRARMVRHLAEKYQDQKPAVIIAIGPQSLGFVVRNRSGLGFDAPIVFGLASRARLAAIGPDAAVTGIISEFDLTKTLTLAQRLQPAARNIVVVAGASEFDRQWIQIARRQLAPYEQKFDTRYFEGLRHDDLMGELKSLSRETIVIMLTAYRDGDGRYLVPAEAVKDVARASSAPVYSPYETHLGSGVVGGHTDSFERIGREVADLALTILAGTEPSALSPRPTSTDGVRVDWRQLQRWGMSESNLPATAEVHYREASFWEQYRWLVIATGFVLVAQAGVLAWMLIERHRRQAMQAAMRQRVLEVIHLNRSAMAGALSASVAHELNQPLAAIQSYADAGAIYLKANPPNVGRVEEMLVNIRQDNQRAAEIISHFRGLLKKSDAFELQELDVNEVVRNTLRIIDPEAAKRGVSLSISQVESSLPVRADQVHLQQVILNLAVNGMDAMQDSGDGRISIQTALVEDSQVEVSVTDSGTGIPADKLGAIFDTFYTTKRHGTGLGLSIARTIVETYGGRIWAENRPGGGAAFRFTLPLSKGASA